MSEMKFVQIENGHVVKSLSFSEYVDRVPEASGIYSCVNFKECLSNIESEVYGIDSDGFCETVIKTKVQSHSFRGFKPNTISDLRLIVAHEETISSFNEKMENIMIPERVRAMISDLKTWLTGQPKE